MFGVTPRQQLVRRRRALKPPTMVTAKPQDVAFQQHSAVATVPTPLKYNADRPIRQSSKMPRSAGYVAVVIDQKRQQTVLMIAMNDPPDGIKTIRHA